MDRIRLDRLDCKTSGSFGSTGLSTATTNTTNSGSEMLTITPNYFTANFYPHNRAPLGLVRVPMMKPMFSIAQQPPAQSSFLNNANKRFKEKYRIKCHLSAGAHGIILWAVDRCFCTNDHLTPNSSKSELNDQVLLSGSPTPSITIKQYAIKRIFIRNRQIPVNLIREIQSLQFVSGHKNIIDILDVCPSGSTINLVFPLLPTNLTALIYGSQEEQETDSMKVQIPLDPNGSICAYFHMLIEGLHHLHSNGIIHRDLKPSNLLIDWSGVLKLADFGQARLITCPNDGGHCSELSNDVCTRWYRAPELLWGATNYGYQVDIWSAGTILAEMCQRWPLFKGETDIEQLSLVVRALGNPQPGEWTENLPDFNKIQFVQLDQTQTAEDEGDSEGNTDNHQIPEWLQKFHNNLTKNEDCNEDEPPPAYLDLLSNVLRYTDRWTTEQLLKHEYFLNIKSDDGDGVEYESYLIKPKSVRHLSGPIKTMAKKS